MRKKRSALTLGVFATLCLGCGLTGCAGHASVELAAADALDALSTQTQRALDEYRHDLDATDDEREAAVIGAFVGRVRRDVADDARIDSHVHQFAAVLAQIRRDRAVAWDRHQRASQNVAAMRETAAGLRRLGVDTLHLNDEARRYFGAALERPAVAAANGDHQPTTASVRNDQ